MFVVNGCDMFVINGWCFIKGVGPISKLVMFVIELIFEQYWRLIKGGFCLHCSYYLKQSART